MIVSGTVATKYFHFIERIIVEQKEFDSIDKYIDKIKQWHHDRNLIEGATDKDQFCKLMQEAGELSDSICKGKDVSDDIGDMIVVLINIAERNKLSINECLKNSWNDIKDRKGKMIDGIFVKEADL
jgi:NTP pyrophosphatase (non-canonical NTP hydrolase)